MAALRIAIGPTRYNESCTAVSPRMSHGFSMLFQREVDQSTKGVLACAGSEVDQMSRHSCS